MSQKTDETKINSIEMISVAERLRSYAEELMEIAKAIGAAARVEVLPEKAKEIEERHGAMAKRLVEVLAEFGVAAKVVDVCEGPTVMRIKIELPPGVKYSEMTELRDNLQGALHTKSLRIEAPIPGEEYIGIETAKEEPENVSFANTVLPEVPQVIMRREKVSNLPVVVGKGVDGKTIVADLASMPHLIVGGASGQGKSRFIHSFICGFVANCSPDDVQFIIADTKCVEYLHYNVLPHLVVPVIADNRKIVFALHWAVAEMEKRLKMFAKVRVRNISDFNTRGLVPQSDMFGDDGQTGPDASLPKSVPYIVIVIDDFADAMESAREEIEPEVARLTAKARAAGIHLVLVTQRPDAKVLTETISANVPGRIAFKTASSIDSEVILDDSGAERLISKGDCLFRRKDGIVCRAQAPYIGDVEIDEIVADAKRRWGVMCPSKSYSMDYDLQKAIEVIKRTKKASTSHFQRQLGYGYNHAAELIDKLEEEGYVAPQDGTGPRKINWEKFGE